MKQNNSILFKQFTNIYLTTKIYHEFASDDFDNYSNLFKDLFKIVIAVSINNI